MTDCLLCLTRRELLARAAACAGLSVLPWASRPAWGRRPRVAHAALADLDWLESDRSNARKRLSEDSDTGALTFYLELPVNWQGGGVAHYHTCSEEVYVLAGDVTLNGRDYLRDGAYLYRPAGIVHGHQEGSVSGCRLIIKTDRALDFNYVQEPAASEEYVLEPSEDGRPHILHLNTQLMDWRWQAAGQARYGVKALSQDRRTGASTRLLRFPAGWSGNFRMSGAASWEWFVIAGDLRLDDNTRFVTDAYSVRPAGGGEQAFVRAAAPTDLLLWRDQAS